MKLMISEEQIRNKLFDEFIKPTNQNKNFIGIEIEIPILNLDKKAVNFDVVHEIIFLRVSVVVLLEYIRKPVFLIQMPVSMNHM